MVAGLDEAGRGPLAGPVVAAAIFLQKNCRINLRINDSKKLSEKQREYFYEILTGHPHIEWGIGMVSEKIIDRVNILEATKLAMQKAVQVLEKKLENQYSHKYDGRRICASIDFLLIDGNFTLPARSIGGGGAAISVPQRSIIKGDQKVFSIAAASIIAKVTRDRLMQEMHKKYPKYGFNKHKGYGTTQHIQYLKNFGPCPVHRKSFCPVSFLLKIDN